MDQQQIVKVEQFNLHEQFASTSIMDQQQIVKVETLEPKCKGCGNLSFTSSDGGLYCIRCFLQYAEDDLVVTAVVGGHSGSRLFSRRRATAHPLARRTRVTPGTIKAKVWSPDLEFWSSVKGRDDDVSVCMKREYGEAGDGVSQNPRNN